MTEVPYVFIVSSLDHPIYRRIHPYQRVLYKKYGIPYSILLNADLGDSEGTVLPVAFDEILYPIRGREPHMTLKFIYAVKMYFRSFASYNEIPNYIVRLNATTYIHIPSLLEYLGSDTTPTKRCLAGIVGHSGNFINGMIMIFSKDVLWNILHDPRIFNIEDIAAPDDVALSLLAAPYSDPIDLIRYSVFPDPNTIGNVDILIHNEGKIGSSGVSTDESGLYHLDFSINGHVFPIWIFRVRNESDPERLIDEENWKRLVSKLDDIDIVEPVNATNATGVLSTKQNNLMLVWVILGFFVILACLFFYIKRRRQTHPRAH